MSQPTPLGAVLADVASFRATTCRSLDSITAKLEQLKANESGDRPLAPAWPGEAFLEALAQAGSQHPNGRVLAVEWERLKAEHGYSGGKVGGFFSRAGASLEWNEEGVRLSKSGWAQVRYARLKRGDAA